MQKETPNELNLSAVLRCNVYNAISIIIIILFSFFGGKWALKKGKRSMVGDVSFHCASFIPRGLLNRTTSEFSLATNVGDRGNARS